jgi:hypothetical protein
MQKLIDFAAATAATTANPANFAAALATTATPAAANATATTDPTANASTANASTATAPEIRMHKWEQAGLGQAPFEFDCVTQNAGSRASCDYCGTAITYEFWIHSHDGRRFKVGCDCVAKVDHDNDLLSDVQRAQARLQAAQREARKAAKLAAAEARRQAALQAQRDRNGGRTDAEVAEDKRKAAAARQAAELVPTNAWLLDVLRPMVRRGIADFVGSMFEQLQRRPFYELSHRQLVVLEQIFCKQAGRRGSKAHKAAQGIWNAKLDAAYASADAADASR